MESAIGGILVLGFAEFAHAKARHRRERPVVGDVLDDGVTRTAVGAIRKRIPVTSIGGIRNVKVTLVAGRGVRGDQHELPFDSFALAYFEIGRSGRFHFSYGKLFYPCERRRMVSQGVEKSLDGSFITLHFNGDARAGVEDEAGESDVFCEVENKRAKANALNNPAYGYPAARNHGLRGGRHKKSRTWTLALR